MKRLLCFLMALCVLCSLTVITAFAATENSFGQNMTWKFEATSCTLRISGNGDMTGCDPQPWEKYRNSIRRVVVEEGITSIGEKAFAGFLDLERIELPDSLTFIGRQAFEKARKVTELTIPDNVRTISMEAFASCKALTQLNLPANLETLEYRAFYECSKLETVVIPALVTTVEREAFYQCTSLDMVRFLGDAPVIEENAFSRTGTDASYIYGKQGWTQDKLQRYGGINNWHEEGTPPPATSGTFEPGYTWKLEDGTLYISGEGRMQGWTKREERPWQPFLNEIRKVVLSGNIHALDAYIFSGCSNLTEVVWPESLASIYDYAFEGCTALTKLAIPNDVGLNDYAFAGCTNLESLSLSEGMVYIMPYTFYGCPRLSSLIIPGSVVQVWPTSFEGCSGLKSVYFTGDMPLFVIDPYYPTHFPDNKNLTLYYPAGNSTWTQQKLQTLKEHCPDTMQFKTFGEPAATEPPATEPPATEPPATEPSIEPTTQPTVEQTQPATEPSAPQTQPTGITPTAPAGNAPAEETGLEVMTMVCILVTAVVVIGAGVFLFIKLRKR